MVEFHNQFFVFIFTPQIFNNNTGPLADLMDELRSFVEDLRRDLNATSPIVDKSVIHAENLRKLADQLGGVLADTKEHARTALEAARVYRTIVGAIEDALKAARIANSTAHEANKKVN